MTFENPLHLVVVDDHSLVRTALARLLDDEPDMQVVGEGARGDEVVTLVAQHRPHVVLLDVSLPNRDGFVVCADVVQRFPGTRCLMVSAMDQPVLLQRALRAGAAGYVLKTAAPATLVAAIRQVAAGGRALDPSMAAAALTSPGVDLTDREIQVVQLIAEGVSDAEAGRRLGLSSGTVRNYLSNAMSKVGARNRVDLVRIGTRDGWMPWK